MVELAHDAGTGSEHHGQLGKPRWWSEVDAEAASREHVGMAAGCLAPALCHMNRAMHCMHLSTRATEQRLRSRVVPAEGAGCRSWRRR